MTEEELALMGYPAAAFQGPAQQPTPEELAAMGSLAPVDAASSALPASDPNNFTSVAPNQQVAGPDGSPLTLPPNTDAANTYGGQPPVAQVSPQQDAPQQDAQPGFYKWAKDNYGLERGQQITVQEKLKLMELHNDFQKEQMRQSDPKVKLETQKLQNEIAAQGTAAANASQEQVDKALKLDESLADVQSKVDFLDKLKTHPGLSPMVGGKGISTGFMGIAVPGTDAANFNADLKRVQGQNFLTAFQQLKGAGQITEIEGAKAAQAISSMSTSQSEEEFKKSLDELQGVLRTGMERTRKHYAALPSSARAAVGSLSQSQVSPSGATAPSTSPAVNRPAMLNLKGVMYQLGPDGSYHKATGAR
jgi:hypothetical protein